MALADFCDAPQSQRASGDLPILGPARLARRGARYDPGRSRRILRTNLALHRRGGQTRSGGGIYPGATWSLPAGRRFGLRREDPDEYLSGSDLATSDGEPALI